MKYELFFRRMVLYSLPLLFLSYCIKIEQEGASLTAALGLAQSSQIQSGSQSKLFSVAQLNHEIVAKLGPLVSAGSTITPSQVFTDVVFVPPARQSDNDMAGTLLVLDGGQGAVYCMCPTLTTYQLKQTNDDAFKNASGIVYWKTDVFIQKGGALIGRWKLNSETGKLERLNSPTSILTDIALFTGGDGENAFVYTTDNRLLKFAGSFAKVEEIQVPIVISEVIALQAFNRDLFIIDKDGSRLIQLNQATGGVIQARTDYAFGAGETLQPIKLAGIVPSMDGYWVAVNAYDRVAHLRPDLVMDGVLPVSNVLIRPYRVMAGLKGMKADTSGRVAVFSSSSIDVYTGTEHSPSQYLSIVPHKLMELNEVLEQIPMETLLSNPNQSVLSHPEVKAFLQAQINGSQP